MTGIISKAVGVALNAMKPKAGLAPKDRAVANLGIAQQVKKEAETEIMDAKAALCDLGFAFHKLGDGKHLVHDSSKFELTANISAIAGRLSEDSLRSALKKRGYTPATINAIVGDAKGVSSTRTMLTVLEK